LDHSMPQFLEPLNVLGSKVCLVIPLFIDNTLSAIVALGYRSRPANTELLLEEARGWADRMTVALSNAKWQEKLYQQANYDSLTGLPNRPAFRTYLRQALDRAERNKEMVGVLFIDLDRFKLVNDTLGHAAGDEYLQEISKRLASCIRSTDMLARLGGDEFTIVVSESPSYQQIKTSISAVAEKLLSQIPLPVEIAGKELRSNASIGISVYPLDATNIDSMMKNADSAMYHAKSKGGGDYHYYSEELNQVISEQFRVENELRQAIKHNQLELYYQPQLDSRTEKILGAEALLRWNHPNDGLIYPDKFIPLAEDSSLILKIDFWVLDAACAQLKSWQKAGCPELRISINLSAHFFKLDSPAKSIMKIVHAHGITPHLLELEITEGTLIEDVESTQHLLTELTELGFQLTIDDFGTGYSSLSYLKQLPIHRLKIDKSFVKKCASDPVDGSLVKTIINLAGNLDLDCIAEGVETEQQLEFLHSNGCHEIQGFYFSKALPAASFAAIYLTEASASPAIPARAATAKTPKL
jgi:diguanylate cyclase (GGDEF)-like protein